MTRPDCSPFEPPLHGIAALIEDRYGDASDLSLVPLAEGSHNQIFLGTGGSDALPDQFVVRYPTCDSVVATMEADCLTRMQTLEGLRTPQVLFFGRLAACGTPVAVEEYVAGTPRCFNELQPHEVGSLAKAVSEVHHRLSDRFSGTSGQPANQTGTYADYLSAMVQESVVDRLSLVDMSTYADAEKLIRAGLERLDALVASTASFQGSTFSLLHHDLNKNNVLWPDGPVLIDWNPTYGDPADDVDYIFTDNQTSEAFRASFLSVYEAPPEAGDVQARIDVYTHKNRLDDLAWTIMMCEEKRLPEWRSAYEQRLDNLRQLLDSPGRDT